LLKDKKILIFGACGLLGAELLSCCLREGADVVAVDLKSEVLQEMFSSFQGRYGKRLQLMKGDITDEKSVKNVFNEHPNLDGLVNCTYPRNEAYGASFLEVKIHDFNQNINLHLGSAFMLMQQAVRYFEQEKRPFSIVNLASIYGVVAPRFEIYKDTSMTMPVEYAAIKSAIIQLTKYTASYVRNSKLRVNCVSPGGLKNGQPEAFLNAYKEQTLSKGMLDAKDVTGTIMFLLSDHSLYMSGQNVVVDDGFTL
jgi:NAD(P)-dependent dehydrogenase (short-subunit alcohol dehydrogenase family)